MNPAGDAAEQIVRMSLNGVEVAAKITDAGAKHLASTTKGGCHVNKYPQMRKAISDLRDVEKYVVSACV